MNDLRCCGELPRPIASVNVSRGTVTEISIGPDVSVRAGTGLGLKYGCVHSRTRGDVVNGVSGVNTNCRRGVTNS